MSKIELDFNSMIYSKVVQLHFINEATDLEIVRIIGINQLLKYEHLRHSSTLMFDNALEVIQTIINCETQAHKEAKRYGQD